MDTVQNNDFNSDCLNFIIDVLKSINYLEKLDDVISLEMKNTSAPNIHLFQGLGVICNFPSSGATTFRFTAK
jgi:hypothetical protein